MAVANYHVSLSGLSHVFTDGRSLEALRNITLGVPQGQFLSIIGPSGCGKSTLLRLIGGLLRPTSGTAEVDGAEPVQAQRRREVGYIFQDPALLPWRTVLGNIRLPLELAGRREPDRIRHVGGDGAALDRAEALSVRGGNGPLRPEELLDLVGLSEFSRYYPHQLSGGMQQRVALARGLAFNPSLLLMDEPFGALDEITRQSMRYELLRLWEAHGRRTVLFVTHSVAEAVVLSDRVVVLSGRPGSVRADIDIELERPRAEEIEQSGAFRDYADTLRELLKEAGDGAP